MWTCDKCGRSFASKNQSHYCGKPPKDINEFLRNQDIDKRPYLIEIYETIKSVIPDVSEKIAWGMPTFWRGCNIIQFSAAQKHIGIHVGEAAVAEFNKKLTPYKPSKGTIRVPYSEPMPIELIKELAIWCKSNAKMV